MINDHVLSIYVLAIDIVIDPWVVKCYNHPVIFPDNKVDPVAGSTAALLHNKVDKVIRVIAETSENQKKMNRVLQDLIKFGGMTRPELG